MHAAHISVKSAHVTLTNMDVKHQHKEPLVACSLGRGFHNNVWKLSKNAVLSIICKIYQHIESVMQEQHT